jgi:hypothetical protein
MTALGVMGAISHGVSHVLGQVSIKLASGNQALQENPITHRPSFFLHPCNTAEAMLNLACGLNITRRNYLQAWLGLVGPAVAFHLPLIDDQE